MSNERQNNLIDSITPAKINYNIPNGIILINAEFRLKKYTNWYKIYYNNLVCMSESAAYCEGKLTTKFKLTLTRNNKLIVNFKIIN